jgi:hypothetical protein
MAFDPEPTRTAVSIGTIVVTLKDAVAVGEEPAYQSAHYQVEVILSDGTKIKRRGDLVPHLEPAQRQGLMSFMDDLRALATAQILGE